EVVAECGPDAPDLVGGDLLSLPGASEEDAGVSDTAGHGAGDVGAHRRVVDGIGGVGAEVQDLVPLRPQEAHQGLLQLESGVVRADGDLHASAPPPARSPTTSTGSGDPNRPSTRREHHSSTSAATARKASRLKPMGSATSPSARRSNPLRRKRSA